MDLETTIEAETVTGAIPVAGEAEPRPLPSRPAVPPAAGPAVYGICVVCHEKTPMARLVAIPATSLCLRCARKEQRWATAG